MKYNRNIRRQINAVRASASCAQQSDDDCRRDATITGLAGEAGLLPNDTLLLRCPRQKFGDVWSVITEALWRFIQRPDNIIRMETAVQLGRAPVEALSAILVTEFGTGVANDRVKQLIGHLIRHVMEACGYSIERKSLRITRTCLFASGARYRRRDRPSNRSVRARPSDRKEWLRRADADGFNRWMDAQVRSNDGQIDIDTLCALAVRWGIPERRYWRESALNARLEVGILIRKRVPSSEYERGHEQSEMDVEGARQT